MKRGLLIGLVFFLSATPLWGQLTDITQTPNTENAGIKMSLDDQVGPGRGSIMIPDSSLFIIARDPFRSIARGRQIFQRKFTLGQGFGPRTNDGIGDIETDASLGAGLVDSCAGCHGRPRGSAGAGGNVVTRPDSRDAPHLFGLGLVEMLADEITADLRAQEADAIADAMTSGSPQEVDLESKGIEYGSITAMPDGTVDYSELEGVDTDLRVKPFFADGAEFSIRKFAVGAFNAEMGLESPDPDQLTAHMGGSVVTPGGLVMDGSLDAIEAPPVSSPMEDSDSDGVVNEIDPAIVDHLEFYLLNYFKPGLYEQTGQAKRGRVLMDEIGCTSCHIPDLVIDQDRRVADVETVFDPVNGVINRLFATASALFHEVVDDPGLPSLKLPNMDSFVVENIFADFKRHDLGPAFWERNFDGTIQREFVTEPLWGVGSTAPYGHDGRSINLREVILRHGGEAQESRDAFADLPPGKQRQIFAFLNSLVIFGPPDTASNLDPGDPNDPLFPLRSHGSISLTPLFNNPTIIE